MNPGELARVRLPQSARTPTPAAPAWPAALVIAAAACAVAGGIVTLVGWAFEIPRLTDWRNDGISMFPNTAVCAALSGTALLSNGLSGRRWRTPTSALGAFVALIGGATLLEHLSGISLGIDTLLSERSWGQFATVAPMRMGLPASVAFLAIGAGLALLNGVGRARSVSAACGITVGAIATLSLTGFLYGAPQMYTVPGLTGIAMPTALLLLVLASGLLASLPDREPMRTILDPGSAGIVVRQALPIVLGLVLAVGLIRAVLGHRGLVDVAFGMALTTLAEIVLVTALLWWAAGRVRAHETVLKEREAESRLQSAQLAAFVDTAAIGLHRVGPDGIILWANDAELQTLGYAPQEYIGHHIAEFHADGADILARLQRGERLLEYPAVMKCKDGSLKSVLIDSSVLWDDGQFVHTQCFTRDVTERRHAEEARALLAAIVEASDDAIVSKSLDGVITSWNTGAERIFGYSAAEAVGRPIDLIIPPDRIDEEREILRRLRAGQRIQHYETIRRTRHGRLLDISLSLSPVRDPTGRVVGASKIARDVTDRRRAEAEREESNRRKDEFIAILAHELRNPLAPVRTAARYLKLAGQATPDAERQVDMIERQVAQMSRLIDDLLDVSRISRGALQLRRERFACAEVVEAAVDACAEEIQAKKHDLRVRLPTERIEVQADRERLVQVLCNLLGNAAKYTPAGGHLDLAVAVATPGMLELSVRDDGIGIPPEKLTEIFDLFARVDDSLERQGGLGIGLTLVRQLVELHGGTIEARSGGIGRGSDFILRLPIVVAAETAAAAPAELPHAGAPLRILVADDNEDAAEGLMLLLELSGHDVHVVFDGDAAVAAAARLRPDVALVDIGMPKRNGYEVARRIREQPWGADVHLVALTGWGQQSDKRQAQEAGFDLHLVKPVAPERLDRLLAEVAASRPAGPALRSQPA
jgi:PAS domain S-box-containing protein